jgi:hypothetical protein
MDGARKENRFIFWQRWLFFSSIIFAFSGVVFALSGKNLFFLPYDRMLANVFWHRTDFPAGAEQFRKFIYGPLGATIACCYILLAFMARYPFKEKQLWARNAIVLSFGVWVIIDSGLCLRYGVYPQIYIINAFSIMVKALPLIFTWNDF